MSETISIDNDVITVTHVAGFFSCCSIRLEAILQYYNTHECRLPREIDCREQWKWYRPPTYPADKDMAFEYFVHYHEFDAFTLAFPKHRVFHDHEDQFVDYRILSFQEMAPFIRMYFSIAPPIQSIITNMINKYRIEFDQTCVLFYRGNDKVSETKLCEYSELFDQAESVLRRYTGCRVLVQSDETEFIEQAFQRFPNHAYVFNDEIRHIPRNRNLTVDAVTSPSMNAEFSKRFLAIVSIMSQCRWIVCTSGNCSVFMMYYRGHPNNVRQYLNGTWRGELS